jgi:transposase
MFDLQFKKSIIDVHEYYNSNHYSNNDFLKMINKCFDIKKTTFYNWMNDENITKAEQIYENNNKLITKVVETYIVNLYNGNDKISIKTAKKKIKENFKISLNHKDISYVLYKNNIKHKNIKSIDIYNENKKYKKQKKEFILTNDEQINFILNNKNEKSKNIVKLFNDKYKTCIHEKQIVDIMNKNKIEIKSFFKSSPSIINFILKSIDEDKTNTVKQIKDLIFNEFKTNVSIQLIYNILKKNNYVYKKFKFNNNPYSVSEQVNQFKKIIETHNEKNINNCVSIDEISFVLGSKPNNGWFKKNEINEIKCNSKKIIRERYSLLVASSNEKILSYDMCKKGVKSDFFINFMDKLKKMDIKNEKYYLLDNARVHKSKKFNEYLNENKMKIVYNAPYHSETNPIENIFSMLRNNLNRNKNETEVELKKSIDDFCAIDNKIKFKNIFNHSCNMINDCGLKKIIQSKQMIILLNKKIKI